MKKGDRVEFKTTSGKVIEGVLQETLEKRAVVKSGNRTYKPPVELVRKAKKKPAKKETPKPKAKKVKVDFDDLYGGPLQNYINDWADGSDEAKAQGFTFAKVRAAIKRMLKDYNKKEDTSIEGAARFIKNMTTKEQEKGWWW